MDDAIPPQPAPLPASSSSTSRLMVFMFTDLVDSVALKGSLGAARYLPLLNRHDELLREALASVPGARVQQDTGDGVFAVLPTASDAVRAALRFQWLMQNEPWLPDIALRARVGIHLGEVVQTPVQQDGGNKLVGASVDLAARVMSLAAGGQILMTREAFNNARQFVDDVDPGLPPVRWSAHGPYLFKGNKEPLEVFEVGLDQVAPMQPPADSEKARRYVRPGDEETLGWRPAIGQPMPDAPHWIISQKMGEGGFGEVWLATHAKLKTHRVFKFCFDPQRLRALKREVALFRLLKDALGDRRDIAPVRDWKFDRSPYFIELDYVPAGNLLQWFESRGGVGAVPLHERLGIIAAVAEALAAAHSVGVLHKDVKPSNILMARDEAERWYPRLADFGIGILTDREKLADHQITAAGFTETDLVMNDSSRTGSRMYAPPESLSGKPHSVQGDIYSLGVLLYQMVVADLARPLASGWERDVPDDLLREDIAACVDVDPARRFASAGELAQRLESLPARRAQREAEARAAQAAQRRLVRRRLARTALVAASVLLALTAAATVYHVRNVNAERDRTKAALDDVQKQKEEVERQRTQAVAERDNATAVLEFLTDDVLAGAGPERIDDAKVTDAIIRAMIQPAAESVHTKFADRPLIEASIRHTLSMTFATIGRSDLALPHAQAALATRKRLLGEDHRNSLESLMQYGILLKTLGREKEAEPLFKEALERCRRARGEEHADTLMALTCYANVLVGLGRAGEAERLYRDVLERFRKGLNNDPEAHIHALQSYAVILQALGRSGDAEPLFKEALDLRRRGQGADHPASIRALEDHASVLHSLGRHKEVEPLYKEVLERRRRVLGADHPDTIASLTQYATVLISLGRAKDAEPFAAEGLDGRRRVLGADHPDTIASLNEYAAVLVSAGRLKEAEPLLKDALERRRRVLGPDHPDTISSLNNYAFVLNSLGRAKDVEPLYREALASRRRVLGDDHPQTIKSVNNFAALLTSQGRPADAEPLLKEALERRERVQGRDHPDTIDQLNNYAAILSELGRAKDAEPLYKDALDRRRRVQHADHPDAITSLNNYAHVLLSLGRAKDAQPLFKEALERSVRVQGAEHPDTIFSMHNYAKVLMSLGQLDDAHSHYSQTLDRALACPSLGPDHPNTRAYATSLAKVLDALSKPEEAAALRTKFHLKD